MKIYNFGPDHGEKIERYDCKFIFSKIINSHKDAKVSCFHLGTNERIGYYESIDERLFLVVKGKGWACGKYPEKIPISECQAVYWHKFEWHEVGTDTGLMGIVSEGELMKPSDFMHMDWGIVPNKLF